MQYKQFADLYAFSTIARLRSFRKAGAELGVSASALSHSMAKLEASLGVRLLARTTRSVAPTDAGLAVLGKLSPALADLEAAWQAADPFRHTLTGRIRVNAPRSMPDRVLAARIDSFLLEHPKMAVEVVGNDALIDIVEEGYDCGVRFGEHLQQDMVALPLQKDIRFAVVAAPQYIARHGAPQHPSDLLHHACICLRFPSGVHFKWEFVQGAQPLHMAVAGPLTVDTSLRAVAAAQRGVGIAYAYADDVAAGVAAGILQTVLTDWMPPPVAAYVYYPSRKQPSLGFRAFLNHLSGLGDAPQTLVIF